MADKIDPERRSQNMRRVRSRDTQPELVVRHALYKLGYRYRLHRRDLAGTPDIVFPSKKLAIFVHGCFWHRHSGCKRTTTPSTRAEFWKAKFDANVARDQRTKRSLAKLGWRSQVIWECETKSIEQLQIKLAKIMARYCSN